MKTYLVVISALLLVCAAGAARAAGTPDGLPPALETVCDMEQGAAFGHCNAYCEAMDCDSATPQASPTACARVRAKFQQATGRDLPCEYACPCADPAVGPIFAAVIAGEYPAPASICVTEPFEGILDGAALLTNTFPLAFSVEVQNGTGTQWICGLVEEGFALPITPAQGQACAQLVEQAANRLGLTCEAPPV